MATSLEYIEFVCEQIQSCGEIRYKKMFGEYMVYVNNKPLLLVCDSTVFVKKLDCLENKMENSSTGIPYEGAKERYILDVENVDFCREVLGILEEVTPLPKPKKKSTKKVL